MRSRAALLVLAGVLALAGAAAPERYPERWVYASTNLLVDANVETFTRLIERSSRAGFNTILLADYKFHLLDRMPDRYVANVRKVQAAARQAGVEIVPALFPIGYSAGLLAHDPNLAEGLPVVQAPFVVRDGQAMLDPAAQPVFRNGGLEQVQGDRFTGFGFQDGPGRVTFADREVVHGGQVSCRMQDPRANEAGNCRITQPVTLRPHAAYRFGVWVKTRDLKASFRLLALAEGRSLTFHETHLKPTQDWTHVSVVFNSLEYAKATLYAGIWGGGTGTLWLDDFTFEELGPVNVLRRPGCPIRVEARDGGQVFEEGRDFLPLVDPKLGKVPYEGEYSFAHPAPPLTLTPQSRIRPGQPLRVSWYHPVLIHGEQVMCCLNEPKVLDLLRDEARRVLALWQPRTVMMSHDEIRVAHWCRACQESGKTAGESLAANARACVEILRKLRPELRVAVWSDMFDPHHNAIDKYYLVNGSLKGSWDGLPASVIIVNWNRGKAKASLSWFAERGHPQVMAGYYDRENPDFAEWHEAARGLPGVNGFMYTTWQQRYDLLETFGRLLRDAR